MCDETFKLSDALVFVNPDTLDVTECFILMEPC